MTKYEEFVVGQRLEEQAHGIIEEISEMLELELLALQDIADGLDDENKARILRRVRRIRSKLTDYSN